MKAIISILVCVFVFALFRTGEAFDHYDCHPEKDLIMDKCMRTIRIEGDYVPPDDKCRKAVKLCNMICVCHILDRNDEKIVDPKKLVRLASECNKPVPVGDKCGRKF